MPTRKAPASLQELTIAATCKLIQSSCKNVEDKFPTPIDMDTDVLGCKSAVQKIQDHLRGYIPPVMWDIFFQGVMELQKRKENIIFDERIIYCTMITGNFKLQTLKLGFQSVILDTGSVKKRPLCDFWFLTHLALFKHLVEVDFTDTTWDVIPAVCKNCKNLKAISLPARLPVAEMEAVIRSCPNLKVFKRNMLQEYTMIKLALTTLVHLESLNIGFSSHLFETALPDGKLKIRKLELTSLKTENLKLALDKCPDLDDLTMWSSPDISSEILQVLATSSVVLTKLSLKSFALTAATCQQLFASKGANLTDLEIYQRSTDSPLTIAIMKNIAEECKNLKSLSVTVMSEVIPEGAFVGRIALTERLPFPKLENLHVLDLAPGRLGISLAAHCMAHAPMLQQLAFYISDQFQQGGDTTSVNNMLADMFDTVRVKQLKFLYLWIECFEISSLLAQHIYGMCSEIRSLKIGKLSAEAKVYFNEICVEAQANNLDFTGSFPTQPWTI